MNKSRRTLGGAAVFLYLFAGSVALAEIKTITATGEYRMGDNDTRTDAKRLALLDAKRLALEQAGTYLENVTEVKNLRVSHDEIRAYTAGIIEVTEQATKDVMEGPMHIVRVEVTAKIDTAVVARQIDALRKNEAVRAELLKTQTEVKRLRNELEIQTKELSLSKYRDQAASLAQQRQKVMNDVDVESLLAQAWVTLGGVKGGIMIAGTSRSEGRELARTLAERALSFNPLSPRAHHTLGLILFEEGKFDDAIREYGTALRLQPDNAALRVNLGVALAYRGDYVGAISEYQTALRLKPAESMTHYNLGRAYHMKGDLDSAIREYRAALDLRPDNVMAHNNLALANYLKGNLDEAVSEYRKALTIKPDHANSRSGLGLVLQAKGDVNGAVQEFREAIRLKPDDPVVHNLLAIALQILGRRQEAAEEYREFIRLNSGNPAYRDAVEQARSKLRDLEGR